MAERPFMPVRTSSHRLSRGETAGIILAQVFSRALAQEHRRPPQDEAIHDKFYSTRIMPDLVTRSLDPVIRARANDGD